MKQLVTVQIDVSATIQKAWDFLTDPQHIIQWNFASTEWECPSASHELKVGGALNYKMAAKDGTMGFDYKGTFTEIKPKELLEYTLDDGRKVSIRFREDNEMTSITESFEVEDENTLEMQRQGWQAILENFKTYIEST